MSNLKSWQQGRIEGVFTKGLKKHLDRRGFLCETFRIDEFPEGIQPVMSYISCTEPGVTRGPHEHHEQTDIFAFPGPGNFCLRLWDNRQNSKTYGEYMEIFAGKDNPLVLVIPPGVVHAYKNISSSERGTVINYPDRLYKGWEKKEPVDEIRHEDDPSTPFKMED